MGTCFTIVDPNTNNEPDDETNVTHVENKTHLDAHIKTNNVTEPEIKNNDIELTTMDDDSKSKEPSNKETIYNPTIDDNDINISASSIHMDQSGDVKEPENIVKSDCSQQNDTTQQTIFKYNIILENKTNDKSQIENKQIKSSDTKETKYKTFVDYSKLYTHSEPTNVKTKTSSKDRTNLIELENKKSDPTNRTDLIEIERKETGIILDKNTIAYGGWCTIKPSKTFIDNSKPKRIEITKDEIDKQPQVKITQLPVLYDYGEDEHMVLLMGYIRRMINQFEFEWILPMDVIILCYNYIPIENSNIFVLTGNRNNYMEYHLFTSDINEKKINYKYQRLEFHIKDKNGNKIKILNEDFDCANCGVCYAKNISIPLSMQRKGNKLNELICYSAIIKCGGEIIEEDMNFCSNYCNAIVFDTNQLILENEKDIKSEMDEKEIENSKSNSKSETDINGNDIFTLLGIGNNNGNGNLKSNYIKDNIMEIGCIELKLPRLKTKCQYKSIYSEYYGLIAMTMDKKNNNSNIYQLEFDGSNNNWCKLSELKYNHLYGNMAMINNDTSLIVLGGGNDRHNNIANKMEIYDWNNNEWNCLKNLHYNVKYTGICYNFLYSNVIIAGGIGYGNTSKLSSCYDIHKNQWFKLPDLRNKHAYYPSVWNNTNNPSIVYCFGDNSNNLSFIEYIDLRDNNGKYWANLNNNDMYNIHHISPSQIRNIVI